jgi:dTDP-4-amino-4,6-dideoxygalactose transaminase
MSGLCRSVVANQDYAGIDEKRRRNYQHLHNRLADIAPPVTGELAPGVCPLFYATQHADKVAAHQRLLERGVESVNLWSYFPESLPEGTLPEVDKLRRTTLELPVHQDLTPEDIDSVADEVIAVWRRP